MTESLDTPLKKPVQEVLGFNTPTTVQMEPSTWPRLSDFMESLQPIFRTPSKWLLSATQKSKCDFPPSELDIPGQKVAIESQHSSGPLNQFIGTRTDTSLLLFARDHLGLAGLAWNHLRIQPAVGHAYSSSLDIVEDGKSCISGRRGERSAAMHLLRLRRSDPNTIDETHINACHQSAGDSMAGSRRLMTASSRFLSRIGSLSPILTLYLFASMLPTASAMDTDHTLQPYVAGANMAVPHPIPHPHGARIHVGVIGAYALMAAGVLASTAQSLLAPLLGISSVLWFIMRNDAAIRPSVSWGIFGFWATVFLAYLRYQVRRVNHLAEVYILLTSVFSVVCLCVIALVQKSSIPGGLVTAIPPCASFAAYATAFCFRGRRTHAHDLPV